MSNIRRTPDRNRQNEGPPNVHESRRRARRARRARENESPNVARQLFPETTDESPNEDQSSQTDESPNKDQPSQTVIKLIF